VRDSGPSATKVPLGRSSMVTAIAPSSLSFPGISLMSTGRSDCSVLLNRSSPVLPPSTSTSILSSRFTSVMLSFSTFGLCFTVTFLGAMSSFANSKITAWSLKSRSAHVSHCKRTYPFLSLAAGDTTFTVTVASGLLVGKIQKSNSPKPSSSMRWNPFV